MGAMHRIRASIHAKTSYYDKVSLLSSFEIAVTLQNHHFKLSSRGMIHDDTRDDYKMIRVLIAWVILEKIRT